ncbi:hypothetical protein OAO87_01860 [bacterium]|nr:hypothetical protein [bacterium]
MELIPPRELSGSTSAMIGFCLMVDETSSRMQFLDWKSAPRTSHKRTRLGQPSCIWADTLQTERVACAQRARTAYRAEHKDGCCALNVALEVANLLKLCVQKRQAWCPQCAME